VPLATRDMQVLQPRHVDVPQHHSREMTMTTTNPGARTPNTIVLIHGLWLTALSWEKWVAHEGLPGHRAKLAGHGGRRRGPSARPVGDHGFVLPFASLKAALPGMKNPFAQHEAMALTAEQFKYGFTNALSAGESLPLYERYAVPGPNHVLFQASLAKFNRTPRPRSTSPAMSAHLSC
jgi:hypothetical protein